MEAIEAARWTLPFWVAWTNLLLVPAAFLLSYASSSLGAVIALRPLLRSAGADWVERARLLYPARLHAGLCVLLLAALFAFAGPIFAGSIGHVSRIELSLLGASAAMAGALLIRRRVERIGGSIEVGLVYWLRSLASVGIVLFAVYFAIGIFAGLLSAAASDVVEVIALLVLAVVTVGFFAFGGGLLVTRVLGLASPASDRLRALVRRSADRTGIHPRAAYELVWPGANALAFPFLRRLAFSDRILTTLTDDELEAVCVHELGHLAEPWIVVLSRSLLPFGLLALFSANPLTGICSPESFVAVSLAFVVVYWLVRRMARRMEERADTLAHSHEGDSGTYARALQKIYEANLTPAVMPGNRQVHPHLYDRLIAAGVQPDYPRPPAPSRLQALLALGASLAVVFVVFLGFCVVCIAVGMADARNEQGLTWSIAVDGGSPRQLGRLAWLRYRGGDLAGAIALYRAATEADPYSVSYPANLAIVLAADNQAEEAQNALEIAESRAGVSENPDERELLTQARQAVLLCQARATSNSDR